jgi:hypothetical protein
MRISRISDPSDFHGFRWRCRLVQNVTQQRAIRRGNGRCSLTPPRKPSAPGPSYAGQKLRCDSPLSAANYWRLGLSMNFPCYWPYGLPPEFVQCVRSFAEAHLLRRLHHSVFAVQQPLAPPRVCSEWYATEAAPPKKRRRAVRGAALQASAADVGDPQQAESRSTQVVAWFCVRVGKAGFIAKLLEKFLTHRFQGRNARNFVRFTLRRACSVCVCLRAFPSMRARPCRADSALIVVRCRVSAHALHLFSNDLQQVAKAFLRDRGLASDFCIDSASDLGDLFSVAASLDSGLSANGARR